MLDTTPNQTRQQTKTSHAKPSHQRGEPNPITVRGVYVYTSPICLTVINGDWAIKMPERLKRAYKRNENITLQKEKKIKY